MPWRTTTSARAEGSIRPPIIAVRSGIDPGFPLMVYRREGAKIVHSSSLHGHHFFVLFYADGGHGELRFTGGKSVPVGPGHIHLLGPGELHDTSGLGSVTGWAAEFTDEVLEGPSGGLASILPRTGQSYWVGFARGAQGEPALAIVPPADRPAWKIRFERLQQELEEARLGYREAARAVLQLILINAARLIAPPGTPIAIPPLVNEVFQVIEARFAEPLSLSHVARAVGRSPSHLTALIRASTGMTVLEWITARRMAEARRRLRETDEDIAIVAERVGYHDATYFIRQFRRAHQLTPRAWRLAHRVTGDR